MAPGVKGIYVTNTTTKEFPIFLHSTDQHIVPQKKVIIRPSRTQFVACDATKTPCIATEGTGWMTNSIEYTPLNTTCTHYKIEEKDGYKIIPLAKQLPSLFALCTGLVENIQETVGTELLLPDTK